MPLGVKIGPVVAMKSPRKPDDPGFFGILLLFGQLVVVVVVAIVVLLARLAVLAWRGVVIVWAFLRHGRQPQPRMVYFGKLDSIGWRCHHQHRTLPEAEACAAEYKLTDEYKAAKAALPPALPAPWPKPLGGDAPDLSSQLASLSELHTAGALSADEFATAKARLLGGSPSWPTPDQATA